MNQPESAGISQPVPNLEVTLSAVRRYGTESLKAICSDLDVPPDTVKAWVRDAGIELRRPGQKPRTAGNPAQARDAEEAIRHYVEDEDSIATIALAMRRGQETVRHWLISADIQLRPHPRAGRPPMHPDLGERVCLGCKIRFKPRAPSFDHGPTGRQRYCSRACGYAARRIRLEWMIHDAGLLTTDEAADAIHAGGRRYINDLIARGQLQAVRFDYGASKPGWGIHPDDIRAWWLAYAKRQRGQGRLKFRDPDVWLATATAQRRIARLTRDNGGDRAAAVRDERTRVKRRAAYASQVQAGLKGGRPRSAAVHTRNQRWARRMRAHLSSGSLKSGALRKTFEAEWLLDIATFPRVAYPASLDYPDLPNPSCYKAGIALVRTATKVLLSVEN